MLVKLYTQEQFVYLVPFVITTIESSSFQCTLNFLCMVAVRSVRALKSTVLVNIPTVMFNVEKMEGISFLGGEHRCEKLPKALHWPLKLKNMVHLCLKT